MVHHWNHKMRFFFNTIILLGSFILLPLFVSACADSMLETGMIVNAKVKAVSMKTDQSDEMETSNIKMIRMAEMLPDNFVPSDDNIVSTPDSTHPIYVFFENGEDAGVLYFYTEDDRIVMNPNSSYIFSGIPSLTDISGLANWDSSNAVSLVGAFSGDSSLSDIVPLSKWDTSSLLYAERMFKDDSALVNITALANWNTSNVKNMSGMFSNARSLTDALALRNWDTSNVTDMSFMFSRAISLMFVDVSNWNTSKVTTMANMFQVGDSWKGNGQLVEIIGLAKLDVSSVTDMTCMFYGAGQMTSYDIAEWNVSKVESMNHMFGDNLRLRSLDLSGWNVSSLKTIYCMFDDNRKLKTIGDVSHWNTANLIDAGAWLNDSRSFVGDDNGMLDLSGWDTSNLKSAGEMFLYTNLRTIDLSGWTFDSITNDMWEEAGKGIYYETGNDLEPLRGLGSMFKASSELTTVYISQAGLDSYNAAVERGVNILDMWNNTRIGGFTVK